MKKKHRSPWLYVGASVLISVLLISFVPLDSLKNILKLKNSVKDTSSTDYE